MCQFYGNSLPYYVATDESWTPVAQLDYAGHVTDQFSFDPYGTLLSYDDGDQNASGLEVGHQGLFFDRLDASLLNGDGGENPRLAVNAAGIYYNRARTYSPSLGRFLQADPNATGMATGGLAMSGRAAIVNIVKPELHTLYGGGLSLLQSLESKPTSGHDPTGLDYYDDVIQDLAYQQAGFATAIHEVQTSLVSGIRKIRAYERGGWLFDEMIMDRVESILIGLIIGPFFSTTCFEAGTPVVMADGSTQAIESIGLGECVFSAPDGAAVSSAARDQADPDSHNTIEVSEWRKVELCLDDAEHGRIGVSLLRPAAWVEATGAVAGGQFDLNLPEMGINGTAHVVSVGACPELKHSNADGQIVTGTFVTEKAAIFRVWIRGESKSIGATANHPFYSLDRASWVGASRLQQDERVRTLYGSAVVDRVNVPTETKPVYNVEVQRTHTYYAGDAKVWVHNPCQRPDKDVIDRIKALPDGARLTAEEAEHLGRNVRLVLEKSLPGKVASKGVEGAEEIAKLFRTDSQFRFIDQTEGAIDAIRKALAPYGVHF